MNKSSKIILSFAVILFISLISINASAGIYAEKSTLALEKDSSATALIHIRNDTGEKARIELKARPYNSFISYEFSSNGFSLNPGEETITSLNFYSSNDAPTGENEVEVIAKYYDYYGNYSVQEESIFLNVNIMPSYNTEVEQINVSYSKKTLCKDRENTIQVRIENNSPYTKDLRISTDSELFLPIVMEDRIELEGHESRYINIKINPSEQLENDSYTINLFVETPDTIIKKAIEFNLTDCAKEKERLFELEFEGTCTSLEKKEEKRIYFTIRNITNEEQTVKLAVVSDIPTELNQKQLVLEPREERYSFLTVKPGQDETIGSHTIELHAFNDEFSAADTKCVQVQKLHSIKAKLIKDFLEIEKGTSKIFEIEIQNLGDYDEEFSARIKAKPSEVNVNFSEKNFVVEKNSKKILYVSINPLPEAESGKQKIIISLRDSQTINLTLNFNVTEEFKPKAREGFIEIESYPKTIELQAGNTSQIKLSIRNISGQDLENIKVYLEGLQDEIAAGELNIEQLTDGKAVTVSLNITAPEDIESSSLKARITAEGKDFKQSKEFQIKVKGSKENNSGAGNKTAAGNNTKKTQISNPITFLASFAGLHPLRSLLVAVIIILILLVLVLYYSKGKGSKQKESTKSGEYENEIE
ncbi:MAG: hypothetical protein AB1467_01945 [Candidatus Diapherotrites archaeon]